MNLVVMAAGMGSRFGGLKQLTSVGPSGEFLIDYSVYDAIKAGVNKVIFIIPYLSISSHNKRYSLNSSEDWDNKISFSTVLVLLSLSKYIKSLFNKKK